MLARRLIGARVAAAAGSSAESSYLTAVNDTSGKTTYSFASVSFGTAASDRLIVVCANPNGSSVTSINSMTIGGISATKAAENQTGNGVSSIWFALVPTGTSGTVTFTCNAAASRARIAAYRVVGASNTSSAHDSDTNTAASALSVSVSVGTVSGSVIIAASAVEGGSGTNWSSAVTEDSDASTGVSSRNFAVASQTDAPGGTVDITATAAAGTNRAIALAVAVFA